MIHPPSSSYVLSSGFEKAKRPKTASFYPQPVRATALFQPLARPTVSHTAASRLYPLVASRPPPTTHSASNAASSSSTSLLFRRAPPIAYTARGSFPVHDLTTADASAQLQALVQDFYAPRTQESKASHIRTWAAMHCRWFGPTPGLPLTVESLMAVAA